MLCGQGRLEHIGDIGNRIVEIVPKQREIAQPILLRRIAHGATLPE